MEANLIPPRPRSRPGSGDAEDGIDCEHHQMQGALIDIQQLIYDILRAAPLASVTTLAEKGISTGAVRFGIEILVNLQEEIDAILQKHGIEPMTVDELEPVLEPVNATD